MNHVPTATALHKIEEWIGRSYALSPSTFGAIESLHRVCDIEGIEASALANDSDVVLWVYCRSAVAGESWLWSIDVGRGPGSLSVRGTTDAAYGRGFLMSLLCEVYMPMDADRLVQWWLSNTSGRLCTFSTTLPPVSEELCDLFVQLEVATREAAMADWMGRMPR